MYIKSHLHTFVSCSHFVKKKRIVVIITIISAFTFKLSSFLRLLIVLVLSPCQRHASPQNLNCNQKPKTLVKIWNHFHQGFLLNMKVVIIEIVIGIYSGNSSECRLEVSATKLADHGTWTCSLSQDKVGILRVMVVMMVATIQGHGYQNMMSGPKRRSQTRL